MKGCALYRMIAKRLADERAATATEYAVMLALVIAVIIATLTAFGQGLTTEYTAINSRLFGS